MPGEVELVLPFRADLTQQHGFRHAGIVTAVVDSARGYAALSLTASRRTRGIRVVHGVSDVASGLKETPVLPSAEWTSATRFLVRS